LGQAYSRAHRREPTFETFHEAHDVVTRLVVGYPADPEYQSWLGMILNNRAIAEAEMVSLAAARSTIMEAVDYQQRAFHSRGSEPTFRSRLGMHYALHAAIARESGFTDEAIEANTKRQDLWAGNGAELYATGRDFALIGSSAKSPGAARRRCHDLAVGAIRCAVDVGFRNADQAANDPALAPLREREDFQRLLAEMRGARGRNPAPADGER
jgi:hypothetical protein